MKCVRPDFYDEFECIADKCSYPCCMEEWNISIDRETVEKYKNFTGELGEKAKKWVIFSDVHSRYYLKRNESGRCPFFQENGLCEIVLKKGPEYLSKTCASFPRGIIIYLDIVEATLSNACPTVTKYMFRNKKLSFKKDYINDVIDINMDDPLGKHIFWGTKIRSFFIDILQLEEFPLWIKQYFIVSLSKKIERYYENKDYDAIKSQMRTYNNLDYLKDYFKSIINIPLNYTLKFKILQDLYKYFNSVYVKSLKKYNSVFDSKIWNLSVEELTDIYNRFDMEVYKDIEYAFENSCVNDLFNKFFSSIASNWTIYEKCMSIFLLHSLIKFTMSVYWYTNNYNISVNDQINIISLLSRRILHNDSAIIDFCKAQEKEGLFNPSYLFVIIR